MNNKKWSNAKLGLFVLAGLIIMITGLYLIGEDSNLFSKNYTLRTRFPDVQGLVEGNNVRYAGIQVGTVKKVSIINDSVIEIAMRIDQKMQQHIRQNDLASLGTDGLMGNMLVNITPAKNGGPLAGNNDLLPARISVSTQEMLQTLSKTNDNLVVISEELRKAVLRINTSRGLWSVLEDQALPVEIRRSLRNIREATVKANTMISNLDMVVADVKAGKGTAGILLRTDTLALDLQAAVSGIQQLESQAGRVMENLELLANTLHQEVREGPGTAHTLLADTVLERKIQQSLSNIEAGTAAFQENMKALQHNFLFRGYFRKLEREKQKAAAAAKQ